MTCNIAMMTPRAPVLLPSIHAAHARVQVPPDVSAAHADAVESAVAALRYGSININVATMLGFCVPKLTWGAFPGNTPQVRSLCPCCTAPDDSFLRSRRLGGVWDVIKETQSKHAKGKTVLTTVRVRAWVDPCLLMLLLYQRCWRFLHKCGRQPCPWDPHCISSAPRCANSRENGVIEKEPGVWACLDVDGADTGMWRCTGHWFRELRGAQHAVA
jgi:hypothetical protein